MDRPRRALKRWIPLLSILPFLAGTAGYILAGVPLLDAMYFSFSLYFVSLVSRASNPLVEIARWSAALVTTAAVLYALKRAWTWLQWAALCLGRDSVAVYCDGGERVRFTDRGHSVLYPGRVFRPAAKSHIIMLESDAQSLAFYEANRDRLRGRPVYIGLRELDRGFLRDVPGVTFCDLDGTVARTLWKSLRLWRLGRDKLTVVIWGGHLAQSLLDHGLLLNLFSGDQAVEYHLVGDTGLYQISRETFRTENADTVSFHAPDSPSAWEAVRGADVVILAEETAPERLQAARLACRSGQVYYYAPVDEDIGAYLNLPGLHPFGRERYADENIRGGATLRRAKAQNFEYAMTCGQPEPGETEESAWRKLDGFTQWSNISSTDLQEVLPDIQAARPALTLEELAVLEHIRWCRFHTLNGWRYGVPASGCRDLERKLHKCLCPYRELSQEDREKDLAVVRRALSHNG